LSDDIVVLDRVSLVKVTEQNGINIIAGGPRGPRGPAGSAGSGGGDEMTGTPHRATLSASNLAAGAEAVLSTPDIGAGKTARLGRVVAGAGVPLKVKVQTVDTGVASDVEVAFTADTDLTAELDFGQTNEGGFVEVPAGTDNRFRIRLTNLDNIDTADVYATVYWSEV
jgi:hypothetical protein